jgi:Transcriptional regulators
MELGPDDEIDHGAPLPPYKQLAAILTARIERGDWQPDRAIPSEQRLVQQYGSPARQSAARSPAWSSKACCTSCPSAAPTSAGPTSSRSQHGHRRFTT